jgi:hypothetical protein
MKIPFRQGLIDFQRDGFNRPQYLVASSTPNYVGFNINPTPTSVAFAHGHSDYLVIFETSVPAAWGPATSGVTNYLYWDIDLLTGAVTYGITLFEPVISSTAPVSPVTDQHWFDLSVTTMKVWNGNKWLNKVRAFAGKIPNGTIASMTAADSEPAGPWRGALQVPGSPGYIMSDFLGSPLRTLAGEFLTTDTPVRIRTTSGTSGVLAVPPNAFVAVRAAQNIPRFSLVYFSSENTVSLASGNPALSPPRIPIGVVQEDLSTNEVGTVTLYGELTYDQWDWSASIGRPLYCGDTGQITTVRPNGLMAYRVGFVKAAKTIIFQIDAETLPQIYQAGNNDIIIDGVAPIASAYSVNGIGERIWSISMPVATATVDGYMPATQVVAATQLASRVTNVEAVLPTKAPLVHNHIIADVIGLQAALDGKAALNHNHDGVYLPVGYLGYDIRYSQLGHTHVISEVIGLQSVLNSKANLVHTHVAADITDFNGAVDTQVATFLKAGANITLTYDSVGDTLTVAAASQVPSLPSSTVVLVGSSSITFSLNTDISTMTYRMQYLAAYPGATGIGGTFNTSLIPTGTTFPTSLTAALNLSNPSTIIGTSTFAGVSQVFEITVGQAPTAFHTLFVGYWTQAFGPALDINTNFGGPLSTYYQSNGYIQGYGASTAGATWTAGDVIGMIYLVSGQVAFFKNGNLQAVANTATVNGNLMAGNAV